jgi:hypothetical protein
MQTLRHEITGSGREPFPTPPKLTPQAIDAIDLIDQCRLRLKLVSSYVLDDKIAPDEDRVISAEMSEALYFSMISIEDDLQRAVDLMGSPVSQ